MSQSTIMPLFPSNNQLIQPTPTKPQQAKLEPPKTKKSQVQSQVQRSPRWDKCHGMKLPVTEEQDRLLRMFWKRYKETYEATSITVFITMMLRFGLRHPQLVKEQVYTDTGIYKTVKPNQIEYEKIGGEHGVAIEWTVSERKALHRIIISVLKFLEAGGRLDHASVQPIRPSK
ncbi:hypothetical protein ACFPOG_12450 [Paenibacillus aestuarii]|uniref:Tyr recombinase domain-containing protein n=1 Tax=Paenibacillus aestuarii TaxID=516965 RepID=A0ABW0K740_9BACL